MKDTQINELVSRFLTWPLPPSVSSDRCACEIGYPNRTGTNLLTAAEAEQMICHLLLPMHTDGTNPKAAPEAGYWGQIELMGHQRIAGHITETTVAGKGMLRVDVPDQDGATTHTRFYSPEAVYCISPTDRQIAIGLAANIKSQPVTIYDVARLAADKKVGPIEEDPNDG